MKLLLVVIAALCLAASCGAYTLSEANYQSLFTQWVAQHGKEYKTADEFQYRYQVFRYNVDYVNSHKLRKPNSTYFLRMNEFGDLTNAEFVEHYLGYVKANLSSPLFDIQLPTSSLPSSVDWVSKGVVTPVKNQGNCGSCWSFSTTGSVESASAIKTGKLVSLSEQELVDCSKNGNMGCQGGDMVLAFKWIIQNGGLCSESDFPYTAKDGKCPNPLKCKSVVTISSYQQVTANSESQLAAAVAQQPVSVAVDAAGSDWQLYGGGVMSDACGYSLDHGVLAVGYGVDTSSGASSQPYWLVKNSWGASWGEKGYIRLLKDKSNSNNRGECGIAMDASYPIA